MSEDKFYGIKHAIDNAILFEGLDEQEVADFLSEQVKVLDPERLSRKIKQAITDGHYLGLDKL